MQLELDLTWMIVGLILTLRLSILAAIMPLLSGMSVPPIWRLALAAGLAAATAPAVAAELSPEALNLTWHGLAGEGLRSIVVSALLAFVVGIPFAAVRFAGTMIGVQIGFGMVNTLDPQSGGQMSVLANLYYLLAVLIFFALDGHHTLIASLVHSCRLVPPFAPLETGAGSWLTVQAFAAFFEIGLRVAAPVILVLLMVSVAMGFVVKTVPQFNILVVGFPIKIAVGLAALGVSMTFFGQVFESLVGGMEEQIVSLLGALRG
ncbi:flagellar biosynthetic protein FliR [bacterium]|nr:flagellar biosynthetic protein FliR [bacterium]